MKLTFLGVGGAFSLKNYNSNMLLECDGRKMLIDCGWTCPFALQELGIDPNEIDDVYISHQHADHIGGLEWFAWKSYFSKDCKFPGLWIDNEIIDDVWENTLRGGLRYHKNLKMQLHDYFTIHQMHGQHDWMFNWMSTIKNPHIICNENSGVFSYGLRIQDRKDHRNNIVITTDTIMNDKLHEYYGPAKIIFHDCEAAKYRSGVHAHYDDLAKLPEEIKNKMWLYHYPDTAEADGYFDRAASDGFAGFVKKGQVFEL